jgi:hypothetical protein
MDSTILNDKLHELALECDKVQQQNKVLIGAIQTALKLIWVDAEGREVLERALEEIEDQSTILR